MSGDAPADARGAAVARGAIFDLDGTLYDTFEEHHASWQQACAEHGVPLSPAQFAWSFGRRNEEIIPALWRDAGRTAPGEAEVHAVAERKEDLFRERFLLEPKLMPGATSLLRSLRASGWRVGAGSSAPPRNVDAFIACLPSDLRFDATVSGADVTHGKPHPEVFLRAAERLGVTAARAVVFEDAPPGVEAAKRAGMVCVAIVSRGRTREELRHADRLIDDFTVVTPASLVELLSSSIRA